jgi:hypothetical protein
LVASTGSDSELVKTIPITSRPGQSPRVVMSLGKGHRSTTSLPDLAPGDRLDATAELEVTTDCEERQPGCVGSPYGYDPVVQARLLLAGDPRETESGDKALALSATKSETCTHRRHHAVIVFADAGRRVPDRGLPWSGPSWINFVLSAHHPDARAGDRLLVGENEPDGTVKGDRGRINAVRLRPASQHAIAPLRETRRRATAIPLGKKETVIYSQPLEHLAEDAQLAVRAKLLTDAARLLHPARVTTRLFLADDPSQTHPGRHASRVAAFRGTITEPNGFNCTPEHSPCTTRKVGIARITRSPGMRLFINLVAVGAVPPQFGRARRSDVLAVRDGGFVEVVRYPARLKG